MVLLTLELISRGTSGYTKKRSEESMKSFVKRITHLYLERKNIDAVSEEDLSLCKNLSVLYLYDNKLTSVPSFNLNRNLTHLYLQNNEISRMKNFSCLEKLQKLYLGNNVISVVEGLQNLSQLQELHIENQRLLSGDCLVFDSRTLQSISQSLQVLSISGNRISSVIPFECLSELMQFLCNDNRLNDFSELSQVFSSWPNLWRLELSGNPICNKSKYRESVIVICSKRLEIFDGKEVKTTSKQFLLNWEEAKLARKKRDHLLSMGESHTRQSKPSIWPHKSAGYVMQGFRKSKQFEQVLAKSATINLERSNISERTGLHNSGVHSEDSVVPSSSETSTDLTIHSNETDQTNEIHNESLHESRTNLMLKKNNNAYGIDHSSAAVERQHAMLLNDTSESENRRDLGSLRFKDSTNSNALHQKGNLSTKQAENLFNKYNKPGDFLPAADML